MSNPRNAKELHFNFYPVAQGDSMDIGFRIRGFDFRFINPRKQERSQDRPWKFLTKADLPEAFVKELERNRPGFFGADGLHRRMGENILAFCPSDVYAKIKQELTKRNREDLERIVGKRQLTRDVSTESSFEAVPVEELSDGFKS
jgi:hypothetical protein